MIKVENIILNISACEGYGLLRPPPERGTRNDFKLRSLRGGHLTDAAIYMSYRITLQTL